MMRHWATRVAGIGLVALLAMGSSALGQEQRILQSRGMHLVSDAAATLKPLDEITVLDVPGATLVLMDGKGVEYARRPAGAKVQLRIGGALGAQTIRALDEAGKVVEEVKVEVDATTSIEDSSGRWGQLLQLTRSSMGSGSRSVEWRGRAWRRYVPWNRDHVHTMKGMRYWDGSGGDSTDMFRESQREDGMIWDLNKQSDVHFHEWLFGPYGYARWIDGLHWVRMPVESDNEYLFVEGMYSYYKQSGDVEFVKRNAEAAIRALNYSMADPARWSEKFKLLKRAYTIDTWDFVVEDKYLEPLGIKGNLLVHPEKSKFGIMFGDNTGYAVACEQLAEMLELIGRGDEARTFRARGAGIRARINELAWNGKFFTHRIAEDPNEQRELGVDEKLQVSLSNAYSLNRGISHAQARAIIRTYQGIRENLPPASPGEWYCIYPPFMKGLTSGTTRPWQYVNGGVSPIIAGELARGAFEHGEERYGADILKRVLELGQKHGNKIRFCYTGAIFPPEPATFEVVDLSGPANMDLAAGGGSDGVPAWLGGNESEELLNFPTGRQEFAGVPFLIAEPEKNGRRAAIGVSVRDGFAPKVSVSVGKKAAALYLLHTASGVKAEGLGAALTFVYDDGTRATQYMMKGRHFSQIWFPVLQQQRLGYGVASVPSVAIAWRGPNKASPDVGIASCGIDNPQPEKVIESVEFSATVDDAIYAVLGMTLSDRPVYVPIDPVSGGGPDNWAAAACTYALVEGLAGVVNDSVAFETVTLSPRWAVADTDQATVRVKYPASGGYVAYRYAKEDGAIRMDLTGSGKSAKLRVLLPDAVALRAVKVDGRATPHQVREVDGSRYVEFAADVIGVRTCVVEVE